jgi:hypothetical protein
VFPKVNKQNARLVMFHKYFASPLANRGDINIINEGRD